MTAPDPTAILARCYDELGRLLAGLADEQLSLPTPNPGWDVRTLLNHVGGGLAMFTVASRGDVVTHDDPDDVLGRDPAATLTVLMRENLDAWRRPGALHTTCHLPLGSMPGADAALLNAVEIAAHNWDLARSIDAATGIDEEVAQRLLTFAGTLPLDELRAAGELGPEVGLPADATCADRLLALTGRRP
ncbi:TIGR03086 family metal-binding protein [Pseudonocardia sp.]|uniref:TIGR03086 family metal-binding protein n=1 Tax=Pseudonocardia sp. TaxID=60912 RepID=UPI003D0BD29D